MTREEAKKIVDGLVGWDNPQIHTNQYDDVWITAVDPTDCRRKTYDPNTGYFS